MVPSPALPPSYKLHRRQQEHSSLKTHSGEGGAGGSTEGGSVTGRGGVVLGEEGEMPRKYC